MKVKSAIAIQPITLYLAPFLKRRKRKGLLRRMEHPKGGKLGRETWGPPENLRTTLCGRSRESSEAKTSRVRTKVRRALQGYESSQNRKLNETGRNYKRQ